MRGEELAKEAGDGTRKTKDQEREGLGVETERDNACTRGNRGNKRRMSTQGVRGGNQA
jgi:hypothetical protein